VIPAQTQRDLLYREPAHELLPQRVQLPIRPTIPCQCSRPPVHRPPRPVRIEDRGTYQPQQRFVLGVSRPPEECPDFYIAHLTA
jgi:hypothetical protein